MAHFVGLDVSVKETAVLAAAFSLCRSGAEGLLQPHGTLYDVGRKSMAGGGDFLHADPKPTPSVETSQLT